MDPLIHKVKVLHLCYVSPLPPPLSLTQPTLLPLTFFDLPYLIRSPSELLLFFDSPIHTNLFIDSLKHSLSLTLHLFYPLSGTLSWPSESPKPIITTYANGDSAVTLTVAESINGNFNHLSSYYARNASELLPLVPQLVISSNKQVPLLAVQITLFPHSGICVGITTHHAVMDGRAAAMFLKTWASICRLGGDTLLISSPLYDRDVIRDPDGLEKLYLDALHKLIRSKSMSQHDCSHWLHVSKTHNPPDENAVTATFELTCGDLARLKQRVLSLLSARSKSDNNTNGAEETVKSSSRFVLACAYTWICLSKASDGSDDDEASIVFVVDCRARSDPPIPSNYFGNCCVPVKVRAKRRDIIGDELNGIVVAVEAIVKEMRGLSVKALIGKDPELRISRTLSTGPNRVCSIAGSTQFGFYELDFGWGKPKKVELASIARTGSALFADSGREDGGIEISLVRTPKEMDAFAIHYLNGLNDH